MLSSLDVHSVSVWFRLSVISWAHLSRPLSGFPETSLFITVLPKLSCCSTLQQKDNFHFLIELRKQFSHNSNSKMFVVLVCPSEVFRNLFCNIYFKRRDPLSCYLSHLLLPALVYCCWKDDTYIYTYIYFIYIYIRIYTLYMQFKVLFAIQTVL